MKSAVGQSLQCPGGKEPDIGKLAHHQAHPQDLSVHQDVEKQARAPAGRQMAVLAG